MADHGSTLVAKIRISEGKIVDNELHVIFGAGQVGCTLAKI
jgi:hypothetical protein